MPLNLYNKKRKFNQTPEPEGKVLVRGKNRFVVQEHHASHLHYDFRLELPADAPRTLGASAGRPKKINQGEIVLKSWALPKGVPLMAGIKHLAIAVEDHPVDYINFHGVIPQGNYGAGTVKIWDKGKFKLLEYTGKSLKFELIGKKLKGVYVLTQFTSQKKNWLIFKTKIK